MKNVLSLLVLLLSLTISAQYDKSSIELDGGLTKVRDVTQVKPYNINLGYRYMPNTKFGGKIEIGYTDLNDIEYFQSTLSGVLNVGRLLEFESFTEDYTILLGVGGTFTNSGYKDEILHRVSNFHLSGFVTNEFKLNNDIFLQVGLDAITGVNSRPFSIGTSTETTTILNFNVGLVLSLGKHEEHADWYLERDEPIEPLEPVVNNFYLNKYQLYVEADKQIASDIVEYVFFKNDEYVIGIQGLNAIKKIASSIEEGETITLQGFASPPASDEYNFKLSQNRCNSVKDKLVSLGIDIDKIKIVPYGEIDTVDGKNVDLSRVVEVKIIK